MASGIFTTYRVAILPNWRHTLDMANQSPSRRGRPKKTEDLKEKYPNGLKAAMEQRKISNAALARLARTSAANISRFFHGERELTRYWAERLAPHLDKTPQELVFGDIDSHEIPIVGIVADRPNELVSYPDFEQKRVIVATIPGITRATVALEVMGDFMRGAAEKGWLLLYDEVKEEPSEEMIGEFCHVELDTGEKHIKILQLGSSEGLYDLESNASPTMKNRRVVNATLIKAFIPSVVARKLMVIKSSS